MKNILLSLILLTMLTVWLSPGLVAAQGLEEAIKANLEPTENVYDPISDVRPGTLQEIIATLIRQVLTFLGVLFISLILYGGFIWMTSAGAEDQISKAKRIISASIIGLAIVLVSYGIAYFVTAQLLDATGSNN